MIHIDQPLFCTREDPILTQGYQFHIRGIRKISEHNIHLGGHFLGGKRFLGSLLNEFLDDFPAAVVYNQAVASFNQVQRHGFSHQTQSDIPQCWFDLHLCLSPHN